MNKSRVKFSEQAAQIVEELLRESNTSKNKRMLYKTILRKTEVIQANRYYGNPIAKKLIPKRYKDNGIKNLYRVELPQFWRMLYTITHDEVEIISFVIDIIDHDDYNKLFAFTRK